jgi:biotin transport system ATP-binding protein
MELRHATLSLDSLVLFKELSVSFTESRIGLIGRNGSGKSSLLRLIKGLLPAKSGELIDRPDQIGMVFQNPEHQLLFPTVMEELCFGLIEQGHSTESAEQSARDLLAKHKQEGLLTKAVHELSAGQKQLLCVLSVLADGANLILLDEPCASLDHATKREVIAMIHRLPQRVIMATHDFDLLTGFDRVIWLDCGKIRGDGRPDQVIAEYLRSLSGSGLT